MKDWSSLFVSLIWHIWKGRNEEVFEHKKFSVIKVNKLANSYYTDMSISLQRFESFNLDPVNSIWSVPPPGYKKLNVDGGYRDGHGAFGGILRDDQGNWLWGIRGRSHAHDPLHAELIALKFGIQAIITKGESRILIETDSSIAVNLIHNVVDADHPRAELINECKNMLAKVMFVVVSFIPWSCSSCSKWV